MAEIRIEELTIDLPSDVVDAVRAAVTGGHYPSASEVVRIALRDWSAKRVEDARRYSALKADIEDGIADLEAGRIRDFDLDAIAGRGRKRSAAG